MSSEVGSGVFEFEVWSTCDVPINIHTTFAFIVTHISDSNIDETVTLTSTDYSVIP